MDVDYAIVIGLAAGVVVLLALWIVALKSSAAARKDRSAAESARDEALARAKRAEDELRGMGNRTYLADFRPNHTYTLVHHQTIDLDGQTRHFGLVRQDGGAPTPFLVRQDLESLEDGDRFACVVDGIVRLDASAAQPQPAAPPEDATQMFGAPVMAEEEHTMMFGAVMPSATASADPDEGLPYLKVTAGNDLGKTFPLRFERGSIGREVHNAVALHDAGASRTHCIVDYQGTGFLITDNNSTNGTLLNGQKIQSQALHLGDTLKLSDTEMTFTCDGHECKDSDPAAAIAAYEKTLNKAPDYVEALKNLAFLLERNLARRKEAQPLWDRIAKLDKAG